MTVVMMIAPPLLPCHRRYRCATTGGGFSPPRRNRRRVRARNAPGLPRRVAPGFGGKGSAGAGSRAEGGSIGIGSGSGVRTGGFGAGDGGEDAMISMNRSATKKARTSLKPILNTSGYHRKTACCSKICSWVGFGCDSTPRVGLDGPNS